jgi:hypothetical protein
MKYTFLIFFVLLANVSCKKADTTIKTNGVTLISSEIMGADAGYFVVGYSFSKAANVNYNITSSTIPDIVLENNVDLQGTVIGANLTSPKNDAAYYLVGQYNSATEAENFFNGLTEFSNASFSAKADNILANQVYLFKSRSNTYAKFWIQDVTIQPGVSSKYVEVTIKWVYQPDGSKTFAP